jgi:hypothetical protein
MHASKRLDSSLDDCGAIFNRVLVCGCFSAKGLDLVYNRLGIG